jgi:hypothetical protein
MVAPRRYPQARRGRERGATLFVVVLAITLLTGIGLYTVHSSALLTRAAGNEREAQQTTYLAELGALATLSELASNPGVYVPVAIQGQDDCRMNQGLSTTGVTLPACYEKSSSTFVLTTGATLMAADSFGTKDASATTYPITGHFLSETTDVAPALGPVPGMDATTRNAFRYYQAKITTIAQLQPQAATTACVENVMQVAGQHITRAHILLGPVAGQ